MADLFLNWGDLGPYGTNVQDGTPVTVDTGGVAVEISFTAQDPYATAFTYNAEGYVGPEEDLNPNSFLKLFDEQNNDGAPATSTATLDFSSTNAELYTDEVQNVSFRINDIDLSAMNADLGEPGATGFEDIVTVNAYDAEGNLVPVTMTPEGGVSVTGQTATGTTEGDFTDATGSILVSIDEPVARIEIVYQNGGEDSQAVTVSDVHFSTVDTGENLPPVANDDSATTPEDAAVIIDVLANDSDPEGGALTVTGATVDTGTVAVNGDGTLTYTPPPGYTGPATISYTIEDPEGNSATADVAVTVTPDGQNSPPVTNPDFDTTEQDTPVTIDDPAANDTDPDGDPVTVSGITQPTNGSATLNPDGTVTYTPDPGFIGEDTIPYTADDGNGGSTPGEIIVTVTPDGGNSDPTALDDSGVTPVDTPITLVVLGNDSDPEGDPLTTTSATDPANGSVAINPDGTITYTPDSGFTGTDTFDYTISDGNGGTDTATVTVVVDDGTNTPPVAFDDTTTTEVDTPITIDPTTNDFDAEDPTDDLEVTVVGDPANGTAVINPDGTVTYTPDAGFTGTDTFTYEIEDTGGLGDQATVTVTVTEDVNDPPVAVDDTATTEEDTPVTIDDPSDNDTDPDGDPLTVTSVGTPTNGSATLNPDGTVTYTPDPDFVGEDTIPYTVDDGNGGTDTGEIVVTVTEAPNSDPDAVDDSDTTPVNTPVTIDVLGNDTDPESDPLTTVSATDPLNGSVTVNPDGTVTYTPDTGFTGTDTFDYTIEDGNGGSDTATVTVVVAEPNSDPDAVDDADVTRPDTPVTIDVLGNDTDPESDPLSTVSATDPANGSVTVNPDGTVTYTPDSGFTGTDTFDYTIEDGNGGSDTATVTVTVADDPNSDPDAVDDAEVTAVDTPVTIDVLGNDTDPESDPLSTTSATDPTNGDVVVNPDGTVTYTPDSGFTGTDTFDYTISDGNGGTDTATVTVTVSDDPNGAPTAVDDSATTEEGTPVTIPDPTANDTDPEDDPLTVTDLGDPANGTATLNPDGTVTYTPDPDFTGFDTIPYTVDDGNGNTDTGEIVVEVTPDDDDNSDPVAVNDMTSTDEETPVTFEVLANDSDPDGDPLSVTGISVAPENGTATVNPDGTITYTPNAGFVGTDQLTYDISDGEGGTDTAVLTITVEPDEGRIDTDVFPVAPGDQALDPLDGLDEDPDPSDDLDDITGTGGADSISTGDDDDTITAGAGDDTINPGIDDDLVYAGDGNDSIVDIQGADTILGGAGDDTIIAGTDTFSNYVGDDPSFAPGTLLNGLGFTSDPNTEDGRDSIQGNNGNDLIMTGDDDDTIDGGQGNDTIDGGIDDDSITGNVGDDSILGGHGSDTIDGGQDDDFIDGSAPDALELDDSIDPVPENDRDSLYGALGNDTILGGDDDDTLLGGSGNDVLDGGIDEDSIHGGNDDDTLIGGDGDDTLNGGAGDDSIHGGADRDVIVVDSASDGDNDTVDGGFEGDDYDQLDLRPVGVRGEDWRIVDSRTDSDGNGIDGTVEFLDGDGEVTGSFDFFNIEEVVPCFTPGTLIATPQGERLVEDLQVGDRVITRDNGIQEIKWVGRKDLTGFDLARKPHFKPILIQKGAMGNNLPEHDMLVSPNHRVLVANDKTALYFEEREVLVAAKHLTGLDGVDEVESLGVSYIHVMFENHEVILSNGAWTESFQPGDYSLKGIGNAQRQEIFELFPELEHAEGLKAYGSARRSLKKHEAQLLTK